MVHDFHPLLLFFVIGALLFTAGLALGLYLAGYRMLYGPVAGTSSLFSALLLTSGLQLLLFAMWHDMENNRHLRVDVRRMWWSGVRANGRPNGNGYSGATIGSTHGATVMAEANGQSAAVAGSPRPLDPSPSPSAS